MAYSTSVYPYDCVCFITDSLGQASGVVIGPHTVLTVSHEIWDTSLGAASNIRVTPGYPDLSQSFGGPYLDHYFQIDDSGGMLSKSSSQQDFAVIDLASDLSNYGSFGNLVDYGGGTVHVTGYPASAGGAQTDQVGTVSLDSSYHVLDYGSVRTSPGLSGGPLWVDLGSSGSPDPRVVGLVSTAGWAVQLTSSDWDIIWNWTNADVTVWAPSDAQKAALLLQSFISGSTPTAPVLYLETETATIFINQAGGNSAAAWQQLGAAFADSAGFNATYSATYASLTDSQAVQKIYSDIFGFAPTGPVSSYLQNELAYYEQYYSHFADAADPGGVNRARGTLIGDLFEQAMDPRNGFAGTKYPVAEAHFVQEIQAGSAHYGAANGLFM